MHDLGDAVVDGVARGSFLRWLLSLSPTYRWGGHHGIDRIDQGLEERVLVGAYELALTYPDRKVIVECNGDQPAAATILRAKEMESECFGVATASLSHVICAPSLARRPDLVRRLLTRSLKEAAADDVDLLILRVDADDVDTLAAAQAVGFRVCEATSTWLADSEAPAADLDLPDGLEVEVHEGDVTAALSAEEVEQLARATAAWELNHFHADPLLPREAVDRFYGRWVHNIASGQWSDCLFVARYDGRLVGVESEFSDRELRSLTGADVRAGEWIVVLENGLGAGRALMSAAGRHRFPGGRYHSWETQIRNAPTIRCIEQTGVARPIRAAYTLHAWPNHG